MGKTRRCRAVVVSASVAALGATGACPPANADNEAPSRRPATTAGAHQRPVVPRHRHTKPRTQRRTQTRGAYVYAISVGGEMRWEAPNMRCAGNSITLTHITFTMPETNTASTLSERDASFWRQPHTVTTGPMTTITMPWNSQQEIREGEEHEGMIPNAHGQSVTTTAARICAAATTPDAPLGGLGEGIITWRLPHPARSVAVLLAQPPANVAMTMLIASFAIQPNGSVPTFNATL